MYTSNKWLNHFEWSQSSNTSHIQTSDFACLCLPFCTSGEKSIMYNCWMLLLPKTNFLSVLNCKKVTVLNFWKESFKDTSPVFWFNDRDLKGGVGRVSGPFFAWPFSLVLPLTTFHQAALQLLLLPLSPTLKFINAFSAPPLWAVWLTWHSLHYL